MASPLPPHILCTGGAGYIGSHTVVSLLQAGFRVSVLDSLLNSSRAVMTRIEQVTGQLVPLHLADMRDTETLEQIFRENDFAAVIHYAGLKCVGESVENPLEYYECNVGGMLSLLQVMRCMDCKILVFSSSATVYKAKQEPITEEDPIEPTNPYGRTKLMIEQIVQDVWNADHSWKISILRYFNPVGAHSSGLLGESPEMPSNLLPYIQQVSIGKKTHLNIFGGDWNTHDGTGIRDYIHVEDLARGHIAALQYLFKSPGCCVVHNLGTGKGTSVLELKRHFEEACGKDIPFKIVDRQLRERRALLLKEGS